MIEDEGKIACECSGRLWPRQEALRLKYSGRRLLKAVAIGLRYLMKALRRRYEAERHWILSFEPQALDRWLLPLLMGLICLNFLDVYTTVIALGTSSLFRELNPIAAPLLELWPQGFLLALALKYLPILPLAYICFARDDQNSHPVAIRVVKLSGLCALVAANALMFYVVFINNIPMLLLGLSR